MTRARALAFAMVVLLVTTPRVGHAAEADPSHGRFDGDLGAALSLGATVSAQSPRATADARFRYLSTAGLFATYEDPLGKADPRRVFACGVELRPLFLARWGTGRELGVAHADLLIDSFALELGAFFAASPGLQAGLGLELPILPRASGPLVGLHGGVRWSENALSGGPVIDRNDRTLYLTVSIGWQQLFGAHVVDLGDRPR